MGLKLLMQAGLGSFFLLFVPAAVEESWAAQTLPQTAVESTNRLWAGGTIVLTPSPLAPFGAQGSVTLKTHDGPDREILALALQTSGLVPGNYLVTLVLQPEAPPIALGSFSVIDPTAAPDRNTSENTKRDSTTYQSDSLVTRTDFQLKEPLRVPGAFELDLCDQFGHRLLTAKIGGPPGKPPPG